LSAKRFPASEGWIRMTLEMKDATPHSEAEIKQFASFGKPDDYEWGKVEQHGKKIIVINREKKKTEAAS
jgi:hypothetical protein